MKKKQEDRLKNTMPEAPQMYMNMDTQEKLLLQSVEKQSDQNFHKIFLKPFKETLKDVKSQKLELVLWIIEHMSWKNELDYSYREIAGESGISYQTVAATMKSLHENNFLCKRKWKIIVNPNVVFKGGLDKRRYVWDNYKKLKEQLVKDEENRKKNKEEKAAKAAKEGTPKAENGQGPEEDDAGQTYEPFR